MAKISKVIFDAGSNLPASFKTGLQHIQALYRYHTCPVPTVGGIAAAKQVDIADLGVLQAWCTICNIESTQQLKFQERSS